MYHYPQTCHAESISPKPHPQHISHATKAQSLFSHRLKGYKGIFFCDYFNHIGI